MVFKVGNKSTAFQSLVKYDVLGRIPDLFPLARNGYIAVYKEYPIYEGR